MVNTDLKNQLVSVFNDPYLSMLKIVYTGYSFKKTLDHIQHLYSHYARISRTDMSYNDENICSPYNAEEPLKGLINSFNGCTDLSVVARNPVSEIHFVCIAYRLIADTGQYTEDFQA